MDDKGAFDLARMVREAVSPPPPLDIVAFATQILGIVLYPAQVTMLRLIYLDVGRMTPEDHVRIRGWTKSLKKALGSPGSHALGASPDILEKVEWLQANGYRHFREVLLLIGRRGGKTLIAAICVAYEVYLLMRSENPQKVLGLERSTDLVFQIFAVAKEQSTGVAFDTVAKLIHRLPGFEDRVLKDTHAEIRIATAPGLGDIVIQALSSYAPTVRGRNVCGVVFDELAHLRDEGVGSSTELFEAVVPGMDQMKKEALILVVTSPWSRTGATFELYQRATAGTGAQGGPTFPSTMVLQLTSWDPYEGWEQMEGSVEPPQLWTLQLELEELRNPRRFLIERRSQFAAVLSPFYSPALIARLLLPYCPSCGQASDPDTWRRAKGLCPECERPARATHLQLTRRGVPRHMYFAHIDPGFRHDNFAVCISHLEEFKNSNGNVSHHLIADYMTAWSPKDQGGELDLARIREDLVDLFMGFPRLVQISCDQGSWATIQEVSADLKARGHKARVFLLQHTEGSNIDTADLVQETGAMGLLHVPNDGQGVGGASLLLGEMESLELRNGTKLRKQTSGPYTTDDTFDAFRMSAYAAYREKLGSRWRERLAGLHVAMGPPLANAFSEPPPASKSRFQLQMERNKRDRAQADFMSGRSPHYGPTGWMPRKHGA